MKILILSPIQAEHEAVVAHLSGLSEEIAEGCRYVRGQFTGRHHVFEVVTQQTGSGDTAIALATQKAVRRYNPVAVLLVGVAGGVKDVNIGDVVVGTRFYGYEHTLETNEGPKARPRSGHYSKHLKALAESVNAKKDWWRRLPGDLLPNVVFGPIASGNKVVGGTGSSLYQFLKETYNDTTAVEMEAHGFGEAMSDYATIPALNIRGISDLLDGKKQAEAAGSKELAAANAAAFAFELVFQMDVAQLLPAEMEVRNRIDDLLEILRAPQQAVLPLKSAEQYPLPPNRAPLELERLQPLTKEDRLFLTELLDRSGRDDLSKKLKTKLDSLYDFQQLGLEALKRPAIERYEKLEQAKADKRLVVLQQYRSNSNDIRDRRVEPVKIDADLDTLQAFDTDIEQTRHFRLSRIKRVVVTELPWLFEGRHVRKETDDFRIADNDMVLVQLRLDVQAYNLLTEAYPNTRSKILDGSEPNTYDFEAKVNHRFYGLVNFILGNWEHVDVIGPESLKQRIREAGEGILGKVGG